MSFYDVDRSPRRQWATGMTVKLTLKLLFLLTVASTPNTGFFFHSTQAPCHFRWKLTNLLVAAVISDNWTTETQCFSSTVVNSRCTTVSQKAAARLVMALSPRDHVSPALMEPHWFPLCTASWRIWITLASPSCIRDANQPWIVSSSTTLCRHHGLCQRRRQSLKLRREHSVLTVSRPSVWHFFHEWVCNDF